MMETVAKISETAGAALLFIGYLNDAAVGEKTFADGTNVTLNDATANGWTVEDVRKTDGTSNTLKWIGAGLLTVGIAIDAFSSYKSRSPASV